MAFNQCSILFNRELEELAYSPPKIIEHYGRVVQVGTLAKGAAMDETDIYTAITKGSKHIDSLLMSKAAKLIKLSI